MLTTEQAHILSEIAALPDGRGYIPTTACQDNIAALRTAGWVVDDVPGSSYRLPAAPPATVVTTHGAVDFDAVMSQALVAYLCGGPVVRRFDSYPDPAWHTPAAGLYTVDVGYGPLDHHTRHPDGTSSADRTTCAFKLACDHFAAHGTPQQQARASAIWRYLGELVLRQDTQGRLTNEPNDPAARVALPSLIRSMRCQFTDDAAIVAALTPMVEGLFTEAVSHYAAYDAAVASLSDVVVYAGKRVVGVSFEQRAGEQNLLRDVVWDVYPDAVLLAYCTEWRDASAVLITASRGLGRRRGTDVDVGELITQALDHDSVPTEVRAELARWHREDWFAGRGARTRPALDLPPANLLSTLAPVLDELVRIPADAESGRLTTTAGD